MFTLSWALAGVNERDVGLIGRLRYNRVTAKEAAEAILCSAADIIGEPG